MNTTLHGLFGRLPLLAAAVVVGLGEMPRAFGEASTPITGGFGRVTLLSEADQARFFGGATPGGVRRADE